MSVADPPPYHAPYHAPLSRTPSYTERLGPPDHALFDSHTGSAFVKQSKNGGVTLRLQRADPNAGVEEPVYGPGASVEGTVELSQSKSDALDSLEVKLEGTLKMQELAEMGTASYELCTEHAVLWQKSEGGACGSSYAFSLKLPSTFSDGEADWPLPPSFEAKMTGVPAFHAQSSYSVTVSAHKSKSGLFGGGTTSISTPILVVPRTRPSKPLPMPLKLNPDTGNFTESDDWRMFRASVHCYESEDMDVKLQVPSSRVYSVTRAIPFYLSTRSSRETISFMAPYAPRLGVAASENAPGAATDEPGASSSHKIKPHERLRVQLIRRSYCDIKTSGSEGVRKDMWRTDVIGDGVCEHAGEGSEWRAYEGHIAVADSVKVGGFKSAGLYVKDFIVLSLAPREPARSARTMFGEDLKPPFHPLWEAFEIKLTTDAHDADMDGQEGVIVVRTYRSAGEVRRGPEREYPN